MGYGNSKAEEQRRQEQERYRLEQKRLDAEREDNRRREELEHKRREAEIRLMELQEKNRHEENILQAEKMKLEAAKIKREAAKDKYQHEEEAEKMKREAEQEKNRHEEKMKELEMKIKILDMEEKKMQFMEKLRSGDISIAALLKLVNENPNMFDEMGMGDVGDALARLIETLQPRAKTDSEETPATQGMLVKKSDVDEKRLEFMAKLISEQTSIADLPKMLDKNPNMFKEMGMEEGAVREALANVFRKLGL